MENSFHGSSGLLTQICPKGFHKLPEGNCVQSCKNILKFMLKQENLIGSLLFPCLTPFEENMLKIFTRLKNTQKKQN